MPEVRTDFDGSAATRARQARWAYAGILAAAALLLVRAGAPRFGGHLLAIATLTALSVCGQLVTHRLRAHVGRVFDMDLGLVLVAVVLAGPAAGIVVVAVPELLYLTRRRRAFWNLGLVANSVSIAATALAGGAVLNALPYAGPADVARLIAAGVAMLIANYFFARLLLAVMRDGACPAALMRAEFIPLLAFELAAVLVGVLSALLLPIVGLLALLGFAALVYLPQVAFAQLLRAPSVAALSVEAAAAVYRDALAVELDFSGPERRNTHVVDALAGRRALPGAPAPENSLTAVKDALLVTICRERAPAQENFSATPTAQVVLVARRWAELTARCTPALSHHEALRELRTSALARDAPRALAAAARIVEREHALTEHIAGVPRLHRTPLPRALRRRIVPVAVARLTA